MRTNTVKEKWRRGETVYGAWLGIPSALSAEIVARQRYDYACIDMQHGAIDFADAYNMMVAISGTATMPFVRVPSNEFGIINKVLDAGAMGVIVPMVNTPEEAEACVRACRYAPEGARSYGPVRAAMWAGAEYFEHANAEIACIPIIETREAVSRLDAILSVPGIDAVYVGPADLSVSLGMKPGLTNPGEWEAARTAIAEACARRGIVAGIHAPDPSLYRFHEAAGYRMITAMSDMVALTEGAARNILAARGG